MTKLISSKISDNYIKERNAYVEFGEPLVLFCHYYNILTLAFIEDLKEMVNPYSSLVDNAHTVAYEQLSNLKREYNLSSEEVIEYAKNLFKKYGHGRIKVIKGKNEEKDVQLEHETYEIAWLSHFGLRNEDDVPIAFFTRGFIEAMIEVAYDLPKGSIYSEQIKGISKGDDYTEIKCYKGEARKLHPSPGIGVYEPVVPMKQPEDTNIDYFKIRDFFIERNFQGSENEGMIDEHGVLFTRMYANYYTLTIRDFIVGVKKNIGDAGMPLVHQLLQEASHKCAFHTIGNILNSPEWHNVIQPQISNPIDFVHGIVAVLNSFGWGVIQIEKFKENEELALAIYSDFESNSYLKMFEYDEDAKKYLSNEAVGYLFKGVTSAIMNLLYHSNVKRDILLTEELYDSLIRHNDFFYATQQETRFNGGTRLVCVAKRKK